MGSREGDRRQAIGEKELEKEKKCTRMREAVIY
jgi:hypothetical protein